MKSFNIFFPSEIKTAISVIPFAAAYPPVVSISTIAYNKYLFKMQT